MKRLTREKLETVLDKLAVLCINGPLTDFGTIIAFVIKKRMTDPIEVHADLMSTSGFQTTFYNIKVTREEKSSREERGEKRSEYDSRRWIGRKKGRFDRGG